MALTCGRTEEFTINENLGLTHQTWKYSCVFGTCLECSDRFIQCPAFLNVNYNCSWREYKYVPKLRSDESLDEIGLLKTGKRIGERPKMEKELVVTTGTRHQFTRAAHRQWKKYAPHNYESKWDSAMSDGILRTMLTSDVLFRPDFSAHPSLRSEKELTCQRGNRASLETCMAYIPRDFDDESGYARTNWCISFLTWNDDCKQDASMANCYRTHRLDILKNKFPDEHKHWRRLLVPSDKCPAHYFSKDAFRATSDWLQNTEHPIETVIRVYSVTAHGGYAGDAEGGTDKRMLSEFIKDETTWREKLNNTHPPGSSKPIVNDAKTAVAVLKEMRKHTKYQKRMMNHESKGTAMPDNDITTINERIHTSYDEKIDHDRGLYACKPIKDGVKGWYVFRFEKSEPGVLYKRRRMCVCHACVLSQYDKCELQGMQGGPGDWVRVEMDYLDSNSLARDRERRRVDEKEFRSRIKKNKFVALQLEESFMGSKYGIGKTLKKIYKARRNIAAGLIRRGEMVVDVTWWTRTNMTSLVFQDSGEVQTVLASRVVPVRVSWGRSRGAARRGGQREGGSKTLSVACHQKLSAEVEHMPPVRGVADGDDARAGRHEDNCDSDVVGYSSDESE
jgi:hypothetical protein